MQGKILLEEEVQGKRLLEEVQGKGLLEEVQSAKEGWLGEGQITDC